jgi:hypothetical protein
MGSNEQPALKWQTITFTPYSLTHITIERPV